jgi:hypothetical protein
MKDRTVNRASREKLEPAISQNDSGPCNNAIIPGDCRPLLGGTKMGPACRAQRTGHALVGVAPLVGG